MNKWIPGYEQKYLIDPYGTVVSYKGLSQPYVKSWYKDKYGYYVVSLYNHPMKPRVVRVHRLVAQVFLESWDEKLEVNHKDGNKGNNHFSNLEMVTSEQNIKHAIENGLRAKINGNAKLTEEVVKEIRDYKGLYTQVELANMYNISRITVDRIQNYRSWK